jgi:hypothetical protein
VSFEGKFTPLQLNALGGLSQNRGLHINRATQQLQGTWTPAGYTLGSIASTTVLASLTIAIPQIYARVDVDITPATYRALLRIGSSVCPALGNSRPTTFKPSYAGWGSWASPGATDPLRASYPPKGNYNTTTAKWLDGVTSYSYVEQAYGSYAWISGWGSASLNSWQKTTDTYQAVYEPLSTDAKDTGGYDGYFKNGFIATVARQAYYEMWTDTFSQYNNIVNSFRQCDTYKTNKNKIVSSYVNSKTFLSGLYSNINDLTTSNISGVTQSFKLFGIDLVATGRAIDLKNIDRFGLPSVLLKTLQTNNVLTQPVKLALIYQNLTVEELQAILNTNQVPTPAQEKKIYDAFTLVTGDDLSSKERGILYGLNVNTDIIKLNTLADLLNPKLLFPNSYMSLTIPRYNLDPTISPSAKIYDFIYINGGVNSRIQDWGKYLTGILSPDLALSCGAISMTLRQVKFINSMDIQRFSQVVANLELTNFNLPLINTGNGLAVDPLLAATMLSNTAFGSGNSGAIRQCDFYGAASGFPYQANSWYQDAISLLNQVSTTALSDIYAYILANANTITDGDLATKIAEANTEIATIYSKNSSKCEQLNYIWNSIGNQLFVEQRLMPLAIPNTSDLILAFTNEDLEYFVRQMEQYALDNGDGDNAIVLERICDYLSTNQPDATTAQNLIASMREARNGTRMSLTGGDLQNNVQDTIDVCSASAKATVVGGKISQVSVINGSSGYTIVAPPKITVYPVGLGARLSAVIAQDGSISNITVESGGSGYSSDTVEIEIEAPPQCQPINKPQQTYADTPFSQLVPPELTTDTTASPDVATAIEDVTLCNCDCWTT